MDGPCGSGDPVCALDSVRERVHQNPDFADPSYYLELRENLVTNLSPETFMAHVVLCPRLPHSLEISDIVLEYWRAVVEASLPLHPVPGEAVECTLWILKNALLYADNPKAKGLISTLLLKESSAVHGADDAEVLKLLMVNTANASVLQYLPIFWKYALPILQKRKVLDVVDVFFANRFSLFSLLAEIHRTWKEQSLENGQVLEKNSAYYRGLTFIMKNIQNLLSLYDHDIQQHVQEIVSHLLHLRGYDHLCGDDISVEFQTFVGLILSRLPLDEVVLALELPPQGDVEIIGKFHIAVDIILSFLSSRCNVLSSSSILEEASTKEQFLGKLQQPDVLYFLVELENLIISSLFHTSLVLSEFSLDLWCLLFQSGSAEFKERYTPVLLQLASHPPLRSLSTRVGAIFQRTIPLLDFAQQSKIYSTLIDRAHTDTERFFLLRILPSDIPALHRPWKTIHERALQSTLVKCNEAHRSNVPLDQMVESFEQLLVLVRTAAKRAKHMARSTDNFLASRQRSTIVTLALAFLGKADPSTFGRESITHHRSIAFLLSILRYLVQFLTPEQLQRFLSWTESYLKIDPPIKITVCRFLEKVSSIPNMASEVFEMAYSKCVIMFSSLMRSEDWIVAVSAFRSLYGFLRVLDHLPSDIPMDDVLKNILTLTPDCVGGKRELEILSLQNKWLNFGSTLDSFQDSEPLGNLLTTFIGQLKELQLPSNSDTQEQLFIILKHLHRLRGDLQTDNPQ